MRRHEIAERAGAYLPRFPSSTVGRLHHCLIWPPHHPCACSKERTDGDAALRRPGEKPAGLDQLTAQIRGASPRTSTHGSYDPNRGEVLKHCPCRSLTRRRAQTRRPPERRSAWAESYPPRLILRGDALDSAAAIRRALDREQRSDDGYGAIIRSERANGPGWCARRPEDGLSYWPVLIRPHDR